ncbi:MAG: PD-(D/E)XK nuclease family protein [Chitinophagaceae bacterium]
MDINKLQGLLNKFSRIPKKDIIPPTYLEIAGQPHYENVCSNILQFYFNTNEQHKLKDLLLKSLLSCLDDKYKDYSFDSIHIEREHSTDNKKRIDLVVASCQDLVVVIENKIKHRVANDLKNY